MHPSGRKLIFIGCDATDYGEIKMNICLLGWSN